MLWSFENTVGNYTIYTVVRNQWAIAANVVLKLKEIQCPITTGCFDPGHLLSELVQPECEVLNPSSFEFDVVISDLAGHFGLVASCKGQHVRIDIDADNLAR